MDFENVKEYIFSLLESGLPKDLYYHGPGHTAAVLRDAARLAESEGISGENLILVKTAALFHDTGFLKRYDDNEKEGCCFASEVLPRYGYTAGQIDAVTRIIAATKYPQKPLDPASEIVCDADLLYMGTNDFFEIAELYRKELEAQGLRYSDEEWIDLEIKFLENHHYFTAAAREAAGGGLRKNIETLTEQLTRLRSGGLGAEK
jgi:predicted metal-dependent HD superfamily phosphohydrolase